MISSSPLIHFSKEDLLPVLIFREGSWYLCFHSMNTRWVFHSVQCEHSSSILHEDLMFRKKKSKFQVNWNEWGLKNDKTTFDLVKEKIKGVHKERRWSIPPHTLWSFSSNNIQYGSCRKVNISFITGVNKKHVRLENSDHSKWSWLHEWNSSLPDMR